MAKIQQRDELLKLDAAEQPEGATNASNISEVIKERSRGKHAEVKKKKRKREKSPASTVSKKLNSLLDQLPQILATANQAAETHVAALRKWEKKFSLASSSDTE